MQAIWTLAIKDLRLLARDRLGLFFVVAFPVIMGVFFGLIAQGMGSSEGRPAMEIGLIDADQSRMSQRFVEELGKNKSIKLQNSARDQAMDQVRRGRLLGFLAIPKGFGETAGIMWMEAPAIELGIDPSRQAEGGMLQGFVMQAMGGLIQERFSNPAEMRGQMQKEIAGLDADAEMPVATRAVVKQLMSTVDGFLGSMGNFQQQLGDGATGPAMQLARIEMVDVTRTPTAQEHLISKLRSPWDISFPSATMWGIMGCVAGFAVSLVRERTEGTLLRLTTAPISRTHILAGKALACFLACVGVIVFMIVLGRFLGLQLNSPALLAIAIVCVSLCFVGLMMLFSVIGKTEQSVAGAGWAIITLLCMFGGGMIPLAFMPGFMQTLSHFSPVKWGILALEGAIWRGFTPAEMLLPCAVLLAIGTAAFAAGSTILSRSET